MPRLTRDLIARCLPARRLPRRPAPTVPEALLRAGIQGALAGRPAEGTIRVFAYGALMWEHSAVPGAPAPEPARLRGFARRWCLRDVHNRGTPEAPGLTLGLEAAPDAVCDGLLYTLPTTPAAEEEALWSVWRHEMPPGFYRHAWVAALPAADGRPPAPALTFIANSQHALYAGALPEAEEVAVLAEAVGPQGPDAEYLRLAVEALHGNGLGDGLLDRQAVVVAARLAALHRAGAA